VFQRASEQLEHTVASVDRSSMGNLTHHNLMRAMGIYGPATARRGITWCPLQERLLDAFGRDPR